MQAPFDSQLNKPHNQVYIIQILVNKAHGIKVEIGQEEFFS